MSVGPGEVARCHLPGSDLPVNNSPVAPDCPHLVDLRLRAYVPGAAEAVPGAFPGRESGGRIDRQLWLRVAVVDRYQYLVGNELRISGDFVECLHDTAAGPAMKLARSTTWTPSSKGDAFVMSGSVSMKERIRAFSAADRPSAAR